MSADNFKNSENNFEIKELDHCENLEKNNENGNLY